MWTYKSGSGKLFHRGELKAQAYSGHGEGKNNPAMQHVADVGPIPTGVYLIGDMFDHPTHGKYCMRLLPVTGTQLYGRSGFLMHGENAAHPGESSTGCIVVDHPHRVEVHESHDSQLVVEDWE